MMIKMSMPASVLLMMIAGSAAAQEPWFNAGQQAQVMSNGRLLQQQTAPDQGSNRIGRPRSDTVAQEARNNQRRPLDCVTSREREALRSEYERRTRVHGRANADSWLRQTASEMGQAAGRSQAATGAC